MAVCVKCGKAIKESWRVTQRKAIPYCPQCYHEEWMKAGKEARNGEWLQEFAFKNEECELLPEIECESGEARLDK